VTQDTAAGEIAADYLTGHPGAPEPAPGHLTVTGDAIVFAGSVLRGTAFTPVGFAVPLDAVRSLSTLDRGTAEAARPVLLAGAMAGAAGVFLTASHPLRDRLLLTDLGDGALVAFAVTAIGAMRLQGAVTAIRPELAAGAGTTAGDPVLGEIRDLLARQVELLERIAARLAP